jgi:hypothetical protein
MKLQRAGLMQFQEAFTGLHTVTVQYVRIITAASVVSLYQATNHHIPQDLNISVHRHENAKLIQPLACSQGYSYPFYIGWGTQPFYTT